MLNESVTGIAGLGAPLLTGDDDATSLPSPVLAKSSELDVSDICLSFDPPKSPNVDKTSNDECPPLVEAAVALNIAEEQPQGAVDYSMARPSQVLNAVMWEISGTLLLVLASRKFNDGITLDSVWNLHWTAHIVLFLCFVTTAAASLYPQHFSRPGIMFVVSISVVLGLSYILGLVCLFYDMQVAISASAGIVSLFYLTKLSFKFGRDLSKFTLKVFIAMFVVIGLYVVAVLILPRLGQEGWVNNLPTIDPEATDSEWLSTLKKFLLGLGSLLVTSFVICDTHSIMKEYTSTEYLTAAMNVYVVHLGFFVFAFLFFNTRIPLVSSSH